MGAGETHHSILDFPSPSFSSGNLRWTRVRPLTPPNSGCSSPLFPRSSPSFSKSPPCLPRVSFSPPPRLLLLGGSSSLGWAESARSAAVPDPALSRPAVCCAPAAALAA